MFLKKFPVFSVGRYCRIGLFALAAITVLAIAPKAQSATVNVNFTGTVVVLTTLGAPGAPLLEPVFNIGDAVTGSLSYDTNKTPTFDNGSSALYFGTPFDLTMTVGTRTYSATGGELTVRDNVANGPLAPIADAVTFSGTVNLSGPTVGGLNPERAQFSLGTGLLDTLPSNAIPDLTALLAMGANNGIDVGNSFQDGTNFVGFDNDEVVRFRIDSVTAASTTGTVPLPATGLLLLGTLLVLLVPKTLQRRWWVHQTT